MNLISKIALFATTLIATCGTASAAPQPSGVSTSPKTYLLEVILPGEKEPRPVVLALGEEKTVSFDGKIYEYTKQETTVPASSWGAMLVEKAAPEYDFVKCNRKSCTYGTKEKLVDRISVTVRIDIYEGKLRTTAALDSTQVVSKAAPTSVWIPIVARDTYLQREMLSAGDTMTISRGKNVPAVLIRMVE
jgi:hypothetical protein